MKTKRTPRIGNTRKWYPVVLCLALVVGLGLLGSAAAMWNDSLLMKETAKTATTPGGKVFFTFLEKQEQFNATADVIKDPTWIRYPSNNPNEPDPGQEMQIVINCDLDSHDNDNKSTWVWNFKASNFGTVPVKFDAPQMIDCTPGLIVEFPNSLAGEVVDPVPTSPKPNPNWEDSNIKLNVSERTPGIHTYTFEYHLPYYLWNGSVTDVGIWTGYLKINGMITLNITDKKQTAVEVAPGPQTPEAGEEVGGDKASD